MIMKILGIETSCDETAAALIEYQEGRFRVLSNVVASQINLHAATGGVVPEVAARAHLENIIPVLKQALQVKKNKPPIGLDFIAVTIGPGLITSLRVGVETARLLAYSLQKPLIAVNHLEGHIYANWLDRPPKELLFPILCLIVSGGHTELVLMRKHLAYEVIGETRDDAAGEAFDKVAALLDLGYPGGPIISKLAEGGDQQAIDFPRPMIDSPNFDFSFAGLKTAVLYYLKKNHLTPAVKIADICASFEQAAVDVLVGKTIRAAKKYQVKTILLGGGVAANHRLREQFGQILTSQFPAISLSLPQLDYTTDNAAMIAAAGALYAQQKKFVPWSKIKADPNLTL